MCIFENLHVEAGVPLRDSRVAAGVGGEVRDLHGVGCRGRGHPSRRGAVGGAGAGLRAVAGRGHQAGAVVEGGGGVRAEEAADFPVVGCWSGPAGAVEEGGGGVRAAAAGGGGEASHVHAHGRC